MEEMEQPIRAINVEGLGAALTAIGKAVSDLADAASTALHYAFDAFQRALDEFEEPDYNPDDPYNVYNIENRHDGARRPPVPQLIPARTLHELYGQGVDHGGPGLPRLTLIRVTDDWPMEGRNGILPKRRQRNETMQRLRPGGNRRH